MMFPMEAFPYFLDYTQGDNDAEEQRRRGMTVGGIGPSVAPADAGGSARG
jgi:hypothetical protein